MSSNQEPLGALTEVVTLEVWYDAFTHENRNSEIKTDVNFHVGIFGKGKDDKVPFKVKVKKARLRLSLEDGPIKTVRSSALRTPQKASAIRTRALSEQRKMNTKADAKASFSLTGAKVEANGSLGAEYLNDAEDKINIEQELGPFDIQYKKEKSKDGYKTLHSYELTPNFEDALMNAIIEGETLLKLKLNKDTDPNKLHQYFTAEIIALAEDIVIFDEERRDNPSRLEKILRSDEKTKGLIHEVIKDSLADVKLPNDYDFTNKHTELILARVDVEVEERG